MAPRTVPEWTIADFIHRGPWWQNHGIFVLNLFLFLPLMTAAVNGYDSSLVNGLQILPAWQSYFHDPKGITLGLMTSAQNLGALVALPFAPYSSDNLGRRATLFIGSAIMVAGVITQCLAKDARMFIGARAIIGVGLSFSTNASPLLITELAYPTQRGKITSVYNTSWYLGSISAAWICFGAYKSNSGETWGWRIPSIVQAFGSVLQLCLVWFIPESPRWLISRGRDSEASRVLARFHANRGDERDPLVVFEVAQIRHALRMEKETAKHTSFLTLFRTPGNRRRTLIIIGIGMFSQWSGNGLVSYYVNLILTGVGITSTSEKTMINGGLQIWNFVCALSGALLVDKLGRRTLFIVSTAGMLITFSMWTLTNALFDTEHNAAAARATIPLIFLFYMAYDFCYTPILVSYTLEILPYHIRAKGFAAMNITVCLTLAFNQFINPWALDALGWKYYIVYCCWLCFELAFVLKFIVETKGRTLEETAVLFDGEEPPRQMTYLGGQAATMSMSRPPEDFRVTSQRGEKDKPEMIEMGPSQHHTPRSFSPTPSESYYPTTEYLSSDQGVPGVAL